MTAANSNNYPGGEFEASNNPASRMNNHPSQTTLDGDRTDSILEDRASVELRVLARKLSSQRSEAPSNADGHNHFQPIFPVASGGPLDPGSDGFDARQWAKAFCDSRRKAHDGQLKTSGIAFKNLDVHGFGTSTDYQSTVANVALGVVDATRNLVRGHSIKAQDRIDILQGIEGVVKSGEMLCVLGPPGSGCSTLLKTIAGDTHGFHVSEGATLNYQGIRAEVMNKHYRGEAIYTAEVDHHYPNLSVGDTLYFAARSRLPKILPDGVTKAEYAEHLRDVYSAMFGISHTRHTRVGNDYIRGVSGGERKRVTICEAALAGAPLQCWDNSTRGLDSANAIEFCRNLRLQADYMGVACCVAIYQAPQAAFDTFDKVVVLYEGRQIFFGPIAEARPYFENLGFVCPEQQTTPDFLTSMTNQSERIEREGFKGRTPQTADEFATAWKASQARIQCLQEVESYLQAHPYDGEHHELFSKARRSEQSSRARRQSPFNLSALEQVGLTLWRSWTMLKGDPSITLTILITNFFEALIISSIFYNLSEDTSSFFRRTVLLFFVVIMNAFGCLLEVITLYEKRKIIEKQARYAFYHPSSECLAAMITDLPYKIVNSIIVNTTLYFMTNLRREPGPFFFFLLYSFLLMLCMSMMFRLLGSATRSIEQAMAPSCVLLMLIALYSGFAVPPGYMQVWLGWLRWINPVFYGVESVFINEFAGRSFPCSDMVPSGLGYEAIRPSEQACSVAGSVAGEMDVDGLAYISASFGFDSSHRWRNLGVIVAYLFLFMALHLIATEYVSSSRSKGEVLVFLRESVHRGKKKGGSSNISNDPERGNPGSRKRQSQDGDSDGLERMDKQSSVFHWKNVCYDVETQDGNLRILDHVDGWVKPGTLTALMGVSGAGKTTLLNVLATRVTTGIVTGEMLVDGHLRDQSFQRKTGYVQQQDLHLYTATVREALTFSALLRQPARYSKDERLAYVEMVISLLDMEEYSDAIIGEPGEGLNVEQRKRLTIGVELASRPELLLFLDEPTSGLDSQTSWSICNLIEKLTQSGQAILCVIHQPSAILFQRFDRLLLLAKGGKTVYFGEIGKNSHLLMQYFVRNGGPALPEGVNPAEHMLAIIGAAPGIHTDIDWPSVWLQSPEYAKVQAELSRLSGEENRSKAGTSSDPSMYSEFAAPMSVQTIQVTKRLFQQYWRSPSYVWAKFTLSAVAVLFIGLSVINSENTQRGLQNQMFGVFFIVSIFASVCQQIFPVFCHQRLQYEARERPSKTYSWQSFMFANILVELVWNSIIAVFAFIGWYFPIGLYRNAQYTNAEHSRGVTAFLFVWVFFLFMSTFSNMIVSGLPDPGIAGAITTLFFILMFAFCGVLAGPDQLPKFWIFMLRVNPFTYIVEGLLGTTLAKAPVECASNELVSFSSPSGMTCGEYMQTYLERAGGKLTDPNSTTNCSWCPIADSDAFLSNINMSFENRWRDFGFLWAYIAINIAAAIFFYWLARVPRKTRIKTKDE